MEKENKSLSEERKLLWNLYGDGEITSKVYQIILLQDKKFIKDLKKDESETLRSLKIIQKIWLKETQTFLSTLDTLITKFERKPIENRAGKELI